MSSNKPNFNEAIRELRDVVLDECEKIFGPILRWMDAALARAFGADDKGESN